MTTRNLLKSGVLSGRGEQASSTMVVDLDVAKIGRAPSIPNGTPEK